MVKISFTCPLCHSELVIKGNDTKVEFQCEACGYQRKGPPGYDKTQAYDYLTKNRSRSSRSEKTGRKRNTRGFRTSKGRRKRRSQLLDQEGEDLEDDEIIIDNVTKVREFAKDLELPKPLDYLLNNPRYLPVHYEKLEKKDPPLGVDVEKQIPIPRLYKKLASRGINKLYQYQEDVFEEIQQGNNIVISAPTGMGKTEAFLLPLIDSILRDQPNPHQRNGPSVLLIYPTKALAADQIEKIEYYTREIGISVQRFDGDTPQQNRQQIYSNPPDILVTNADMIHYHLMGNLRFQTMMRRVKHLVIDEIHLCTGSFGSNVLWIIRRLRRFSLNIQCIGASATISNAESFSSTIFDTPVNIISLGTARRSDMHLTMLYPQERSNLSIMAEISEQFIRNGRKTLVFGNGHKSAEVVNMILSEKNIKSGIHRAGLGMKHRNRMETMFKNNQLDALVSTPTLELGIDIGSLDSVISMLTGLTSFVQRIGRAGRGGQESFATLVLRGDDPISAYYARNPDEYLTDIDPAFVEPDNSFVAKHQIMAMVLDKPMEFEEAKKYETYLRQLTSEGLIRQEGKKIVAHDPQQLRKILHDYSIRGIGNSVEIRYMKKKLGDRTLPMALSELHPEAVYLSGGRSYKVINYDPKLRTAKVTTTPSREIRTQALRNISPRVNQVFTETEINGLNAAYCELELTEEVHGFTKHNIFNNKTLGKYYLDNPIDYSYKTMGFLIALPRPDDYISHMSESDQEVALGGTYHAIEHVLIESGNAYSGGGANQIGGISMGDTGLVFVYDGSEGGSGLSRLLFDSLEKGLHRSLNIMDNCPCKRDDGCPRCTYSYQCGNNNQPLNRIGGIEALQRFGKDNTELFYNFEGLESFVIEPEWEVNWKVVKSKLYPKRG